MEIVSPARPEHDREVKRQEYAQAGIPEYWIVDLIAREIIVLTLGKKRNTACTARLGLGAEQSQNRLPDSRSPLMMFFRFKAHIDSMNLLGQLTRLPFVLGLWHKFPIGSVATRVEHGIFPYPHYAFGVYWSAVLAARLKIPRISVLEFGVAGGRGLVALEQASAEIEKAVGVGIDVVGFDSGEGMPPAADYRDLPHIWSHGFYKMDQDKLRAKLTSATLVLGDIRQTVPDWLQKDKPAPLGFISF